MQKKLLIFVVLAVGLSASRAHGSVVLASLNSPTLQTLISLGSDGVTVEGLRFYDFGFVPSPFSGPVSASDVSVAPVTSGGDGIAFLSNWSATSGDGFTNTISYRVDSTDESASISTVSLVSDGTAGGVAPGAFIATSLTARDSGGTAVGRALGTFNDGVTTPVDSTNPDNNTDFLRISPENSLGVTDSIFLASGVPGRGGDVSATIVENTFDPVSVPSPDGTLVVPFVAGFGMLRRRPRIRGNRAATPKVIENGSAAVYKCSQPIA